MSVATAADVQELLIGQWYSNYDLLARGRVIPDRPILQDFKPRPAPPLTIDTPPEDHRFKREGEL